MITGILEWPFGNVKRAHQKDRNGEDTKDTEVKENRKESNPERARLPRGEARASSSGQPSEGWYKLRGVAVASFSTGELADDAGVFLEQRKEARLHFARGVARRGSSDTEGGDAILARKNGNGDGTQTALELLVDDGVALTADSAKLFREVTAVAGPCRVKPFDEDDGENAAFASGSQQFSGIARTTRTSWLS